MKPLLLAIAVLALSSAAKANLTSGELKTNCEEAAKIHGDQSGNGTLGGICLGFMEGYTATINSGVNDYILADGSVFAITLQDGITVGQMVRVYLKWITNHPEQENKAAVHSLGLALLDLVWRHRKWLGSFNLHPLSEAVLSYRGSPARNGAKYRLGITFRKGKRNESDFEIAHGTLRQIAERRGRIE